MTSGEDFLYRPILRGMCKAESLQDGTLDLLGITKLNECIDVERRNSDLLNNKD